MNRDIAPLCQAAFDELAHLPKPTTDASDMEGIVRAILTEALEPSEGMPRHIGLRFYHRAVAGIETPAEAKLHMWQAMIQHILREGE